MNIGKLARMWHRDDSPVPRKGSGGVGHLQIAEDRRIVRFVEKPKDPAVRDSLRLPQRAIGKLDIEGTEECFLTSMGIYVFNREVVRKLLDNDHTDFGKPSSPLHPKHTESAHISIRAIGRTSGRSARSSNPISTWPAEPPHFNFGHERADLQPPAVSARLKGERRVIDHAVILDGCIINPSKSPTASLGLRMLGPEHGVEPGVALGCDYFESKESIAEHERGQNPASASEQIARSRTRSSIKTRIGNNVVISPSANPRTWIIRCISSATA